MGPFECDLLGNVYEMTVVDSKCGWIETVGIKDKSSTPNGGIAEPVLQRVEHVL